MASSSSKNENNASANAAKLSLFHPKSTDQQTNSQSVIPPSPGKPNKQTSSAEDEGNNDNSNSQSNNEKVSNKTSGRWTKDEHKKFIEGIQKYGRNWKKVEEHIGTRTGAQIRSHAQKFFNRLEKEAQNSAKVSDQSRQLLEIMNNSSHHHNSSSNQNTSSASSSAKQAANQTASTQNSSNEKTTQQEKEKKPIQNLTNSSSNNSNNITNNNNTNNISASHIHNNITDSPNSIHAASSAQQNLLNQSSISLGNNDNFTTSSNNYKKIPDSQDIMKQLMTSNNSNKYQSLEDYTIHDYLKEDSNETLDYNGNNSISNSQLKMLYDQAIKIPSYNQSSQYQSYFPSKFSNNNSHVNLSSSYNNNSNHSSHNNSHNSHNSHGSPIPYSNYNNHYNNYNSNYGYNQSNNMNGYGSNNHYSYQQMKSIYDERDSEEIMEKYTRQIQENSAQENSFFIEHHLADIEKPRLYDMCALGQQDLCPGQQNYQSEIYVPNFKKGRSRFGSFKLHDEENESSNQKYQNFRKASIDDQELKKKLKLNDGTSSFVTNSNKLSPDSQVLN
ncbi:hypothetical protein ABPG74_000453 [Tetrahymena malaccensis]